MYGYREMGFQATDFKILNVGMLEPPTRCLRQREGVSRDLNRPYSIRGLK